MPTATYEPIATTTITANASSITFTSIPTTYTDLVIVGHVGNVNNVGGVVFQLNGVTSGVYCSTWGYGNGSTTAAGRSNNDTDGRLIAAGITFANVVNGSFVMHIFDYSNTTTFKQILCQAGAVTTGGAPGVGLSATCFKSTSAITSWTLLNGSNVLAGTQITIYGIKAT